MNNTELIPLIPRGDEFLVDGRLLHQFLQVKKDFRHWIVDRIAEYNFKEGEDYFKEGRAPGSKKTQVVKQHQKEVKNGMQIDYSLTLDMAKELSMIERSDMGKLYRRYFIAKEKEARLLTMGSAPNATDVFKAIPSTTINGMALYQFTPLMRMLGYSVTCGAKNRKENYPNHFLNIGNHIYITQAYAAHLFKSSLVIKSRRAVKAMQPLLGPDFAAPLQIK